MYRFLAKFYPRKIKEGYTNLLRYAGVYINAAKFIGFITVFGFLLALTAAIYLSMYFKVYFLILFIAD